MSNFIYSTLTANTAYAVYAESGDGSPSFERQILIKGGSNVADKHFITPYGVMTEVSDEDLATLKTNPVFQKHLDGGFLKIQSRKNDAEVVASDMTGRDQSAPLVDADFEEDKQPITTKKKKGK